MVTNNESLEQRLRRIADRSGRTLQQLADDVLTDYADEVESLEGSLGADDERAGTANEEQFVYVRRRQTKRAQP